jgi:hypothetical protein
MYTCLGVHTKMLAVQKSSDTEQALSKTTSAGFFGFKLRHFVMVALLLVTIFVGLYFFTIQSDAYQEATHFALTNPEVMNVSGPISEVNWDFWSGFHVVQSGSGGEASFVLSVKGAKDEAVVLDVRMMRAANSWIVNEAYLTSKNHQGIPIKQKAEISGEGS